MNHVHHHHHRHSHSSHQDQQQEGNGTQGSTSSLSKIRFAFILNFLFTCLEFVGGYYTNSMAITSDALHDLGDSLSLGLTWYFEKVSHKRPDKRYSFGLRRFSLLGAVINSLLLLVGSLFILKEAIPRLLHPSAVDAKGMLWISIVGIIINGLAAWRLHGGKSYGEKVVSLHLLEDVLGWGATLIVSIVMLYKNIPFLDPLLSIAITIFVLWNVIRNLREMGKIFMQSVPESLEQEVLKTKILMIEGVRDIHHTHIWSLDGQYHILTAHVVVVSEMTPQQLSTLKKTIKEQLQALEVQHSTIEFEFEFEPCKGDC